MKPLLKISLVVVVAALAGNRIADYLYDLSSRRRHIS